MGVDGPQLLFILGLIVIILFLLRLMWQRIRQSAERQQQRETALKAAQDAERKKIAHTNLPKSKVILPQTRFPLGDSMGTHFTGGIQGQAARWEAEIHQLGRQIVGQIDAKMAALQAITMDANRTANRLEVLVEHLEQLMQKQFDAAVLTAPFTERTVMPASEPTAEATPLTEMLQELTADIEEIRHSVKQSTGFSEIADEVGHASVLRVSELQSNSIRDEIAMLLNYGVEPKEIAQRLNVSPGEVDLVMQLHGR